MDILSAEHPSVVENQLPWASPPQLPRVVTASDSSTDWPHSNRWAVGGAMTSIRLAVSLGRYSDAENIFNSTGAVGGTDIAYMLDQAVDQWEPAGPMAVKIAKAAHGLDEALHYAVTHGMTKAVSQLVIAGAKPQPRTLTVGVMHQGAAICEMLLDRNLLELLSGWEQTVSQLLACYSELPGINQEVLDLLRGAMSSHE